MSQGTEKEQTEERDFLIYEQIEILRKYLNEPEKREEIAVTWQFKRAYGIFCSLSQIPRRIFYGKKGEDVVEGLAGLM